MNGRCHNTGKVVIGRAYVPPPRRVEGDAIKLQAALLEPRTTKPQPLLLRVIAPVMRWL